MVPLKEAHSQFCGYSIVTLRHAVPDGLATVDSALIKKFFSHVLEMEKAYRGEEVDTSTSKTVARLMKTLFASHRRVLSTGN